MDQRSCLLTALPVELQSLVVEHLLLPGNVSQLCSLSCTCSFYRSLLAPCIFKTIQLVNSSESGLSVDAVARGRHCHCVQALHYQGLAFGDQYDEFWNTEAVFPDIVGKVLSDLKRFPNLRTVTFEFPFEWWEWEDQWSILREPESPDEIHTAEEDEGWRALMLKSFDALSKNITSSIEEFEIKRLVAKEVSAFTSKDFHNFLGNLKTFSVSLHDWWSGTGLGMNMQRGFVAFAEKLGIYFFDHLQSTTDFSLKADKTATLGIGLSRYHVHLPLRPSQFPLLRKLALRYIHVCPELVDFLITHLETLEELVMTRCQCSLPLLDEDTEGMHWYELFDALAERQPPRLRKLEITPTRQIVEESVSKLAELDSESKWRMLHEFIATELERNLFSKTREFLMEDPKRRLFAYTNFSFGTFERHAKEEWESLLKGEDQRAYDRLMAIVEGNREKGNMPA